MEIFLAKISNTNFALSYCLEFLIIFKKSLQVIFWGKVQPGNKSENDNFPQN